MPSAERRREILELYGFRCVYCGAEPEQAALTIDHVQPRMKGGDHSRGNLVACCVPCNTEKAGLAAWAFLATRPEQRSNFLRYAQWVWPRHRRAVEEAL